MCVVFARKNGGLDEKFLAMVWSCCSGTDSGNRICGCAGARQQASGSTLHRQCVGVEMDADNSGWEITVVSGNHDKEGEPFTIRFHGEDGSKVPPHWHPTDGNITVLKGAFLVAEGEKYDE